MSDANEVLDAAEAGKSCCTPAPEATCVTGDGKCIPLDALKKEEEEPGPLCVTRGQHLAKPKCVCVYPPPLAHVGVCVLLAIAVCTFRSLLKPSAAF